MEAKKYHIIQTDLQKEIAHGIRVSNLAYRVGRQLKLPEDICYQLAVAGLVHEIYVFEEGGRASPCGGAALCADASGARLRDPK